MKVSKGSADVYHIRGTSDEGWNTWGDVVLMWGKESVQVLAHSDYGTYAFYWSHCGICPKKFLCKIDMYYAMTKLTGYKLEEPDPSQYPNEVKRLIIESRREGLGLTKDEARTAWDEMLSIVNEFGASDLMYQGLIDHELFEKVFGDGEMLPSSTRIKPQAQGFWNNIWLPLIEQLNAELTKAA